MHHKHFVVATDLIFNNNLKTLFFRWNRCDANFQVGPQYYFLPDPLYLIPSYIHCSRLCRLLIYFPITVNCRCFAQACFVFLLTHLTALFGWRSPLAELHTPCLNVVVRNEMMPLFKPAVLLRGFPCENVFWKPKTCKVPAMAM